MARAIASPSPVPVLCSPRTNGSKTCSRSSRGIPGPRSATRIWTPSRQRAATETLVADLARVFGARLRSVVAYGTSPAADDRPLHGLALVESLTFDDLQKLIPLAVGWHKLALAVPLILPHHEFLRTLDAFPLEYGNIIASHVVLAGENPFADARVSDADRRRGCEQDGSHPHAAFGLTPARSRGSHRGSAAGRRLMPCSRA